MLFGARLVIPDDTVQKCDPEKGLARTSNKLVEHVPHCDLARAFERVSSRPIFEAKHDLKTFAVKMKVKMTQAVWGEKWWGRKKRKLQDNLEERRRNEENDRLADTNRLENMRQRRIKRKMGACKYYCWPCGRTEYDKMFPKANIVVADPEAEEAERQRKVLLQFSFKTGQWCRR